MADTKSLHILNTSATLLGLCFIVLTSLSINKMQDKTFIDELTAIAILMFMVSCFFSFMSMRSSNRLAARFENIADLIFFLGLFFLFIITSLIIFNII